MKKIKTKEELDSFFEEEKILKEGTVVETPKEFEKLIRLYGDALEWISNK